MWRELIMHLDPEAEFQAPATLEQVAAAETALGVTFPADLRDLLLEANGAVVAGETCLIWAAEDITQRNLAMRDEWQRGQWEDTMAIDHLLFFGDRGNGDLFFLPLTAHGSGNRVFLWDHEDDSRISSGVSLADWLQGKGHTF